jgi:hypothetical protein
VTTPFDKIAATTVATSFPFLPFLKGFAGSFEWISAFIGLAAFISLFRYKVPAIPAVGACAAAGLVLTLFKHI